MRTFATMIAATAGYVLLIGMLLSMSTVTASPTLELTAELGEPTVLAVEIPAVATSCEPAATLS